MNLLIDNECLLCHAEQAALIQLDNSGSLPEDIQWMPPGRHTITCFVSGKPETVTMNVTAALANLFNSQLQQFIAKASAGEGDEPFLDFDHTDGERSADVLALYWAGDDPRTGGIRARVKWTAAGKSALTGRNYRRFSPTWVFDKARNPIGIDINLGGLVNRAAFPTIARVVAKNGSASNNQNLQTDMTTEEYQKIVTDALKPFSERLTAVEAKASAAPATTAATAQALDATKITELVTNAVSAAVKPLNDKIESGEKNRVQANAKSAVQVHINRGAIAPQDKDGIAFWESAHIADAGKAEAQMAKLSGRTNARIINGQGDLTATATLEPENIFIVKAREAGTKLGLKTDADCFQAFAATVEGRDLYDQVRSKLMAK